MRVDSLIQQYQQQKKFLTFSLYLCVRPHGIPAPHEEPFCLFVLSKSDYQENKMTCFSIFAFSEILLMQGSELHVVSWFS